MPQTIKSSLTMCQEETTKGAWMMCVAIPLLVLSHVMVKWFGLDLALVASIPKDVPIPVPLERPLEWRVLRWYLDLSHLARRIIFSESFNYLVVGVICVAGVNVGVQSYNQFSDVLELKILDSLILWIFTIEIFLKILAEGLSPHLYFIGKEWKWNCFDFFVVFLSLPCWGGLFGGGSLALLRMIRLLRLAKIIKKIPELQVISRGLVGGLSSIIYILLLLALVYYLFAVAGYYLFSRTDPFHFGSLPVAILTMFRCATLDGWSNIMYVNMFGCEQFPDVYVSSEQSSHNSGLVCQDPEGQYALSAVYFIFFVIVSALVMLSLFIGAVTISMEESLEELEKHALEKKKAKNFERNAAKLVLAVSRLNIRARRHQIVPRFSLYSPPSISKLARRKFSETLRRASWFDPRKILPAHPDTIGSDQRDFSKNSSDSDSECSEQSVDGNLKKSDDTQKQLAHIKAILSAKSDTTGDHSKRLADKKLSFLPEFLQDFVLTRECQQMEDRKRLLSRNIRIGMGVEPICPEDQPKSLAAFHHRVFSAASWKEKYNIFCEHCRFISEHNRFNNFFTFVIILAGITVGGETDPRISAIPELRSLIMFCNHFILLVFTAECFVKIFAQGFSPWTYFRDNWSKFDFLIVVASYTPGVGSLVTILRLLRLLRVLKLVKSLPQLAVIIDSLLMGMTSIGYVAIILFLCLYMFSILGMIIFSENDPFNFRNLELSMFTLFRCSTLDNWSDIMYINIYGCDVYPGVYADFPELCDKPRAQGFIAVLYFNSFVILGAQILLTLFIGVITTSMEQAQEDQDVELKFERQLKTLKSSLNLSDVQMRCFGDAFRSLDLDGSGIMEETEISICFESIKDLLGETDVAKEVRKIDPLGKGIDFVTFIVVMCNLPQSRKKRYLREIVRRWRIKRKRWSHFSRNNISPRLRTHQNILSFLGDFSQKTKLYKFRRHRYEISKEDNIIGEIQIEDSGVVD